MSFTSQGRSVVGKTMPSVLSTRPRARLFPLRTSRLAYNNYVFWEWASLKFSILIYGYLKSGSCRRQHFQFLCFYNSLIGNVGNLQQKLFITTRCLLSERYCSYIHQLIILLAFQENERSSELRYTVKNSSFIVKKVHELIRNEFEVG